MEKKYNKQSTIFFISSIFSIAFFAGSLYLFCEKYEWGNMRTVEGIYEEIDYAPKEQEPQKNSESSFAKATEDKEKKFKETVNPGIGIANIKFEELTIPDYYLDRNNYHQKVSPDGRLVAVIGDNKFGVFDLFINKEIVNMSSEDINGRFSIDYPEGDDLFEWETDEQLRYPVYSDTDGRFVFRLISIKSVSVSTSKE